MINLRNVYRINILLSEFYFYVFKNYNLFQKLGEDQYILLHT